MRILICLLTILCSQFAIACDFKDIRFIRDFPGARLSDCHRIAIDHFVLTVEPEATPINDSPWYAFQVVSDSDMLLYLALEFIDGPARYLPKLSSDGKAWSAVSYEKTEQALYFMVPAGSQPTWVAAQELLLPSDYQQWMAHYAGRDDIAVRTIGRSVEGRNIDVLEAGAKHKDTVVILGRQHPPEVTGALAMFHFVNVLLGDDDIAKAFRQRFFISVIPVLNPDGVVHGNWRLNQQGVDTNRDWGPFTQPETKAVYNYLEKLTKDGHKFYLGLDFHSTNGNYFYTQKDEDPLCPAAFTQRWVGDIKSQLPAFQVKRSSRTSDGNPTFKQWFNTTYGVPSISYEMDDNIDRDLIIEVAQIAARSLMEQLLTADCQ